MCTQTDSQQADNLCKYSQQAANPPALAKQSAIDLARLMERQLGYAEGHIDPIALRLFIRAYWSRVSAWAHNIHHET